MVNNKDKTRSGILQQLESIKGLLSERPLAAHHSIGAENANDRLPDLSLNRQERHSLQQECEKLNAAIPTFATSDLSAPLAAPPKASPTPSQSSLFDSAPAEPAQSVTSHVSFAPKVTLNPQDSYAKAQGENPFLPQHIRERLHGNNPPPIFSTPPSEQSVENTHHRSNNKQSLINALVEQMRPDMERHIRLALDKLSEEELGRLLTEDLGENVTS